MNTETETTRPTHAPIVLEDQGETEPISSYQTRVLRFALRYGIAGFSLRQLEIADARAQEAVCRIGGGKDLDQDARKLDDTLHALRLRLQKAISARRKAWTDVEAQLQDLAQIAAQEATAAQDEASQDQGPNQDSDQDRAVRLLRAALLLILDQGTDQGGGGRKARLQPPGPDKGPGSHADTRTPRAPGSRF